MVTREDITRLGSLRHDEGIVSAYIKIDPRLAYERNQPVQKFKGAYARARRTADEDAIAVLKREYDRIVEFLEGWKPDAQGLAVFSGTPAGVWEVWSLDFLVPSWVIASPSPEVQVLARALDEQPRVAVVMLEGGNARVYVGERGHEELAAGVKGQLPGRHDQGGWSQARYQRHREFHHDLILGEAADRLKEAFYEKGFDRVVIVGVDEAVNGFEAMLDDPIRERVIGHLSVDYKQETDESVLEKIHEIVEEDERRTEMALVDAALGAAEAGDKGAVGVDDTIKALVEQRVATMLVADGVVTEGSLCQNCDYLSAQSFEKCPVCSATTTERVPDLIDEAIERAYRDGARVNIVFGDAAGKLIPRGGVGAILRYAQAPA